MLFLKDTVESVKISWFLDESRIETLHKVLWTLETDFAVGIIIDRDWDLIRLEIVFYDDRGHEIDAIEKEGIRTNLTHIDIRTVQVLPLDVEQVCL